MKKPRAIYMLALVGVPIVVAFFTSRSFTMNTEFATTFALLLSLFSVSVIAGAAFMGAYRFLKNVGLFKGHYYY
ncbi:MAG: hypothetical protein C4520_17835 [Candidatus Abyssobacteria bacterium SURF_5]|jgi:hypothetical protein|uniref:Uncharacterized protein n=1 Tax=Abyssobacteria bacterium (strain SURF_5) TaxID=2093360 RepID=A0A3A4N578_ABYX5|nr:MAG: hypothetical protein C4520_17835 [Candidatus Abyssubacteria bacterium SURF_5]